MSEMWETRLNYQGVLAQESEVGKGRKKRIDYWVGYFHVRGLSSGRSRDSIQLG